MPLEGAEIEGIAEGLIVEAGYDPGDPPGAVAVMRRLLGDGHVREAMHRGLVGDAQLLYRWRQPVILVRPGLEPARRHFAVAHEGGEWALDRIDYRDDDRERVANAIAAALIAPRRAFLRAVGEFGYDLDELAAEFCAPVACAALRIGEACDEPLALVTPSKVHRRDPLERLPDNEALYRICRAPETAPPVRVVPLATARNHYVVRLAV